MTGTDQLGVVARGGIEPPTRGFSVRRRARLGATSRRPGRGFSVADRTAVPDRAYPEPGARRPAPRPAGRIRFNGLGTSRPNFFRPGRRTGPRCVQTPRPDRPCRTDGPTTGSARDQHPAARESDIKAQGAISRNAILPRSSRKANRRSTGLPGKFPVNRLVTT